MTDDFAELAGACWLIGAALGLWGWEASAASTSACLHARAHPA